ncbi:MAG: hypothetical protein QF475_03555 [Candidatus Undinarchaeales archaeon]|jgi:hypothetical protein|nr:hypothetical protein [Candidatus Undinarchaeales archaeon]
MRNCKGSATVMEQVFIMVFGVLILITVVVTFSQLRQDTVEYAATPQFEAVAQQIHAVIATAQENMRTADFGYISFTIPHEIAGENYVVRFNTTHIRVEDFAGNLNQSVMLTQSNITVLGNISSQSTGKSRAYFNSTDRSVTFTTI